MTHHANATGNYTFAEIGDAFGISWQHVQRADKSALEKFREAFADCEQE